MNYLVIIPARGGSKGIKNKNIKLLKGKPLINYTIEEARKVFDDSKIYISTDSIEIKNIVEDAGIKVPFIRPEELATDTANSRDVVLHAINHYEKKNDLILDYIILLQPTSPFRNSKNIMDSLTLWNKNIDMVVSVKETKSNPYYTLFEENSAGLLIKSKKSDFTRRQDIPKVWELNGAIYLINALSIKSKKIHEFNKVVKYEMDEISSLDIDNKLDWLFAETVSEYLKK
jgi:CMP-N,N'-diacetyllegionaminic acid synthase